MGMAKKYGRKIVINDEVYLYHIRANENREILHMGFQRLLPTEGKRQSVTVDREKAQERGYLLAGPRWWGIYIPCLLTPKIVRELILESQQDGRW
jgi:hypothetical protein